VIQGVVDRAPLRNGLGLGRRGDDREELLLRWGRSTWTAAQYGFALRGLPTATNRIGAWIRTRSHIYEPSDITWYRARPTGRPASVISIRAAGTVFGDRLRPAPV